MTEAGMLHRLQKEIPGKVFIPGPTENCSCGECRFMKMNTLEKAHDALLQHGAGNHFAGTSAQTRRSADPPHARAEPLTCVFVSCHSERSRGISYYCLGAMLFSQRMRDVSTALDMTNWTAVSSSQSSIFSLVTLSA